jgi:hypothetical protein
LQLGVGEAEAVLERINAAFNHIGCCVSADHMHR